MKVSFISENENRHCVVSHIFIIDGSPKISHLLLKALLIGDIKNVNHTLGSLELPSHVLVPHKLDGIADIGDLHISEKHSLG